MGGDHICDDCDKALGRSAASLVLTGPVLAPWDVSRPHICWSQGLWIESPLSDGDGFWSSTEALPTPTTKAFHKPWLLSPAACSEPPTAGLPRTSGIISKGPAAALEGGSPSPWRRLSSATQCHAELNPSQTQVHIPLPAPPEEEGRLSS